MKTESNKWGELDNAAKSNLKDVGLDKFFKYKNELKEDGHEWDNDAYEILSGFIWEESELYNKDN